MTPQSHLSDAAPAAGGPEAELHTDREIAQQPRLWRELADGLAGAATARELVAAWLDRPDARILLTGAGTSAYAGQVVAPWLTRRLSRTVEAVSTTDLVADPRSVLRPDTPTLLVSFARSGQSPESVAATRLLDQLVPDSAHLVLTCHPDGQLAREHRQRDGSAVVLMPPGSNDQSFAMTSSFTSMTLAALLLLDPGEPGIDVEALSGAGEDLLAREAEIDALAGRVTDRVVYLGSGSLLGLARESGLKLLELTAGQRVAWSESSLGFRHGPKSVLTPTTVVVVHLSNDPYTRAYDLDIVAELVAGLGPERVVAVDAAEGTAPTPAVGTVVALRGTAGLPDAAWGLAAVVLAQRLARTVSLGLGLVPDNPFPSGEVNRVVQGVTLHQLLG